MTPHEAAAHLATLGDPADNREMCHFVVNYIEDLKKQQRLMALDVFIKQINPCTNIRTCTAVLRSSYSVSPELVYWQDFLEEVRIAHCDNPRLDRILVGLDNPYKPSRYT